MAPIIFCVLQQLLLLSISCLVFAQWPATVHIPVAPTAQPIPNLPYSTNPSNVTFGIDTVSFLLNGIRIMPAAGEYHPTREPVSSWANDLAHMKAGGLDAVSAYVFWLHIEEVQGQLDWSGNHNISAFVDAAATAGLLVQLRAGPWAHGEARNGGFPDWVQSSGAPLRSNNTAFMALVKGWYAALSAQLRGRYWADGGPIVSVQLDNETPDIEYLLALRDTALAAGMMPPLFTKTGWPTPNGQWPPGSLVPFFGGYADDFWDRTLTPDVSTTFLFSQAASLPTPGYPYLDVELGGGMASSYHRRIHVNPSQTAASAQVALGGGANQLGFYMYHGATQPVGRRTTLQEQQGQGEGAWNDLPVMTYDFHAPLGQAG